MGREGSGLGSRSIIGTFFEALEQAEGQSWVGQVSMLFNSDQESETYKWLGMMPQMREWIGPRLANGLREYGLTITNQKYEATLEIGVDELRRDKTDQIRLRIQELADRTAAHWAKLLSTLISNGNVAGNVAYDKQLFFDVDHVVGDSGTHKNLVTATEVPNLNVATATAPTPEEMAKAVLGVINHFYTFKDDKGEPINELARNFIVMCTPDLWAPTIQAINQNMLSTGSGVIENPLKGVGFNISAVVNPRLTTAGWTDKFVVFRTDGRAKPLIRQSEEDVTVSAVAEGSELEFHEDMHRYGVKAIRNVGYGMWEHAIRATLS